MVDSSVPSVLTPRDLLRASWLVLAVWTLAMAASVAWNARLLREAMVEAATHDARTSADKDLLYLLNPAFMTRQVHALKATGGSLPGHITRLHPVHPENAPDAWEVAALQAFEQGRLEVISREPLYGQRYLRFMKPVMIKAACLECHAGIGYKVGDVGGGLSVEVPLDPYLALARTELWPVAIVHTGLWALGVLGILWGAHQMRQRLDKQLQAEASLQALVREKEALLREVHHRVKNNLQVIASLLRLERGRTTQPDTVSVFTDMQSRIQSMALLHESLYRSGTFTSSDLGAYLRQLTTQLASALAPKSGAIQIHMDLASVPVEVDQAIPCGLLVNELITNCFKHGFPDGRSGEIRVELQPVDGGPAVRLRVSDTGVSLPADFESRRSHSLGLQLISDLVRQLHGTLEIGRGPGASFTIVFTPKMPVA